MKAAFRLKISRQSFSPKHRCHVPFRILLPVYYTCIVHNHSKQTRMINTELRIDGLVWFPFHCSYLDSRGISKDGWHLIETESVPYRGCKTAIKLQ